MVPDRGKPEALVRRRGRHAERNEWLDTWDEHRIDLEEVIEGSDGVVAVIHITATGKASGVETDVRFYAHIKMQDHQIVYIFDHRDRRTALKAVGVAG